MTTAQMELLKEQDCMTENLKKAVKALQEGGVVLLLDAHERENEGDLVVAAEKITTETMNFLIKQGSGVVCLAMSKDRLDHLGLPLMIPDNTNFFKTAFTVSIEAKSGVTTGVSAKDRAHTIQVAMADDAESAHLARPGHVFPLAAQENGVFERMGHTEGSVDLMRMASLKTGAVLCELMNADGSMTVGQDRINFAHKFGIPVVSIEEILFHRILTEDIFIKTTKNTTGRFGPLTWHSFAFLDSLVVDIFHKPSFEAEKACHLSLVSGDNLPNRFIGQILQQSEDDALFFALESLKQDQTDVVVMTRCLSPKVAKPNNELSLKFAAVMFRTLLELQVKTLSSLSLNEDLQRIAKEHFAIKII